MQTQLLRLGARLIMGSLIIGSVGTVVFLLARQVGIFQRSSWYAAVSGYGIALTGTVFFAGVLLILIWLWIGPARTLGKTTTGVPASSLFNNSSDRAGASLRPDPTCASLYIELLKNCVSNHIYNDDFDLKGGKGTRDPNSGRIVSVGGANFDEWDKYYGNIWPSRAHTMIGVARLDNIRYCVEEVLRAGVPGDLIETGVWRGGATIFMRGILKAYGVNDRNVWVADCSKDCRPRTWHATRRSAIRRFTCWRTLQSLWRASRRIFNAMACLTPRSAFSKVGSATRCRRHPLISSLSCASMVTCTNRPWTAS